MAIGELFIGAFITMLFEKVASGDLIRLARSAGIHSDLNKLRKNLALIRAVLVDAGEKRIKDTSVHLWLNELQHLAYEIDDVLDDLATEAEQRQLKSQESDASTSKVLKFIPTKFNALKYGLKMRSKLDGISTKLLDLVDQKQLLGLNENVERPNRASRVRTEETSLVDESTIIGREGDKRALLKMLLGSEYCSQNVSVVSIVGLGGIGKSTLAQLLYNDKEVKSHFEAMSWVCISDEFNVFTISMAIFKDVGGGDTKFKTLNQLQVALTEKLSKKRFLLVLDDVWNKNHQEWDRLQRPFTVGAPGSKILVTTRNANVASVMDSVKAYPLDSLVSEDALSLFAQHALGKQNFDSHPTLKLHGEGIVKKCGGLPLALRTLGRVLRTKSNDEEWEELLNSELWYLHDESNLFPALRLSYYDLPSHLKQMFAYCCLFPKDYMFDKDEIVLLWMAEGFLYESKDRSMESFGQECFEELVSRSFFQHSANDEESGYTMHDLLNDLATNVAGEIFLRLDDKMDFDDKHKGLDKFHHLSFIRERYERYKRFKELPRARRLRTFLARSVTLLPYWDRFYISNKALIELLPKVRFLRVLSLANYYIREVPDRICSLKHLRYLNFSNTLITCLPEQVGDLHNLQSLLLSGCRSLSSLPTSIAKLKNLRHLDISNTPDLKKTPLGIDGLTCLQTLSKVVVGGADEFNISDLKDLSHLQGQLSIEGLDKVKNAKQAKDVKLQQKKGICGLRMAWSELPNNSQNETTAYEVLDGLRPFEKLRSLKILYYTGTRFPSWVGDLSFRGLTKLTLRGCRSCTCLPTLGHLPLLQKLFVESMDGIKSLGSEFLGLSNGVAFPKLEVLKFKDMKSWEKWSVDIAGAFPSLSEISLINCGKLDVVAIEIKMSLDKLRVLHVEGCSLMVLRSMVDVSSSIVRLIIENIKGLTQQPKEVLEHLKEVERLNISNCDELIYLWEPEAATHEILLRLQMLEIRGCKNLVTLGEKDLQSVKTVVISFCERLKSYNCPSSIEKLKISFCDSLTSLSFPTMDDHPSNLNSLDIRSCDNVEVSWLDNNFLSSLEYLFIYRITNLRLFPEGCLVHLTSLTIYNCDNIESIPENGYGFLPSRCLRYLTIRNCKNLKLFPHEHLQSLASLEEMDIRNCPNLDDSFPCGLWPNNLSSLYIGELKKPISKWGKQNFPTSLVTLMLNGEDSGVVSFAKAAEDISTPSFLLPSSLTNLGLIDFRELESLSEGLQHLTCLQDLHIWNCPKLSDLPETLLPSLSRLYLSSHCSQELRKKCSRQGKYWPIISQIPDFHIRN